MSKNWEFNPLVFLGVIAVVIIAAMYFFGNGLPLGAGASVQGTPSGTIIKEDLSCPPSSAVVPGAVEVLSIPDNNGQETQVADHAAVYRKDSTVAEFTLTTSATAIIYGNTSASETLTCLDVYKEIVGNGTGTNGFYYQDNIDGSYLGTAPVKAASIPGTADNPTWITADRAKTSAKYVVDKIGTFSVLMSNGSEFPKATLKENLTLSISEQNTNTYLRVKNTAVQTVLRAPIICSQYNVSAFDSIHPSNGVKADKIPKTVSAYQECWKTGVDFIKSTNFVDVPMTFTVHAGATPAAEPVKFAVIDTATRINQGVLYEDYETIGGGTDIGAADATFSLQVN